MNESSYQNNRQLAMLLQLQQGQILNKQVLSQKYGVSPRSIQRDIESLRNSLADQHLHQDIVYDKSMGGFYLQNRSQMLSNSEVLAVCKILLESRSLVEGEMIPMLDRLVEICVPEQKKAMVKKLVGNEERHYTEVFNLARSFTLTKRYLVSDFSSSLWYAISV